MFQKFIIILLLTILSLRPAYFVGNVVYYGTHLNEIVEKYCVNKDKLALQCNGQCHLAKEITSIDSTSHTDAISNASVVFFPVFYQEILQTTIFSVSTTELDSHFNYEFTYHFLRSSAIYKPPMV